MKRKLFVFIFVVVAVLTTVSIGNANGDQVRGEKGMGLVKQVQVVTPPPQFP